MAKKKITYDNVDYLYDYNHGSFWNFSGTNVYEGTPIIKLVKKYFFFGPLVAKKSYKWLFFLTFVNIEDENLSKSDVEKLFKKEITKLNRKKEIENGEIL